MSTNETSSRTAASRLGTFVLAFPSPMIGRLAVAAGAQFVVYDTEHTGWGWETVGRLVETTRGAGAEAIIKLPGIERTAVTRALDTGANGVMVPMVETVQQGRDVVEWASYPPAGTRGSAFYMLPDPPSAEEASSHMEAANRDVSVILMIESRRGVNAAAEIAAVEGVDTLWIGPYDLSVDLGVPGRFDDPRYVEARNRVVEAAHRHGKRAGRATESAVESHALLDAGFGILAFGNDIALYRKALATGLDAVTLDGPRL